MRVRDCWTSSREVTRCCCSARRMSESDASNTLNPRCWAGANATAAASAVITTKAAPRPFWSVFIGRRGRAERPARLLQQIRLDERVEIAVEHAVDVADLHLGAMVLDHLVRLQHVAANLAAEADFLLRPRNLLQPRGLLLRPEVVESRPQDLHRLRAVLVLRPLVLARDDDAGRQVRDADRGVGDVDVLAAGAARPVRVDAQILLVDLDVDVLLQLGPDEYRGKRRMAARGLGERGNPHEPLHAGFRR